MCRFVAVMTDVFLEAPIDVGWCLILLVLCPVYAARDDACVLIYVSDRI